MSHRHRCRCGRRRAGAARKALLALVLFAGLTLAAPAASQVVGTITPGGAPVTVTMVSPGENATLTFDGTAGQRVSLEITDVTIGTSACCSTKVSIIRPDAKTLVSVTLGTNGGFIDATSLPLTGTYSIVVDPQSTSIGSATLALHDVPADTVGTIAIGGAPVFVTTTSPGQNARLTFDGVAAQRVSFEVSDVTIGTSVCCSTKVSVIRPDGKTLTSATMGTSGGFVDAANLPLSGTYTIVVDPQSTSTGSATVRVYDVPADTVDFISIGGPPVSVTTTVPGQNARATFSGLTGQRVSLEITDVTIGTSACCSTKVSIIRPDGRTLASATLGTSGGFIDAATLPQTGTYTIVVDPMNAGTGGATLRLYDVPPDVTATAVPGGADVTVTTTVPGQNARITFNGVVGQRVSMSIGPACCAVRISVLKPNGAALANPANFGMGGGFLDTMTLPNTGTYTVVVDPQGAGIGSTTVTLFDVPPNVTGTIVPGGPAVTVTTTVPGQNATLAFSGVAGQRISVKGGPSCCPTRISVVKPNGVVLVSSPTFGASGGFIDAVMLPTSGTYSLLVDPQLAETGSVTVQIYDVPADVTAAAVIGGPSASVTTTVPGQNASVTFEGVAGQRMSLEVEPGCCSAKLTILKPNAATLVSPPTFGPGGGFLDTITLPNNGTYTILVDLQGAATGTVTFTLHDVPADVTGTIVPGGPAVTVTTTVPGQNAVLTFDGVAGQRVSLKVGPSCCTTKVSLLRPDGSVLASVTSFSVLVGFLETTTLPTSGTYTVLVDPQGSSTGSVTVQLFDVAADVTGTIDFDIPVSVTLSTPGQNARFTFAGTAGQTVSLDISSVSIGSSALSGTTVSILRPDGSTLASANVGTNGGFIDAKTLASTGTYTVVVDPHGANTGGATLTLQNLPVDVAATITAGGPAVTVTTTAAGQNARVTFSGVAGQRVSLTVNGNCCLTQFSILRPEGTTLVSPVSFGAGGGFVDATTLPVAGTYTVFVDPQGSVFGDVTLTLHDVPADASALIAPNGVPVSIATTVPGQNAVASFSGTAGQEVSLRLSPTCCAARVAIRNPDGTTLVSPPAFGTGGGFVDTTTLPTTGTYTVAIDPQGPAIGSMTLTLWDVPADSVGTATLGGAAVTVTTTTPGQNARVTFAGSAGDGVSVVVGPFNCCSTKVSLLAPDGGTLAGPTSFNPDGGRLLARLPSAGTYTVFVDPQGAGEGNLHIRLELDNTAPAPPLLTLTESFPDSHVIGATFFYRPGGAGGSVTVSATASDGGTGLDKITFPGLTSGFTPTTLVEDKLAPYAQTYSWAGTATYSNAFNLVTAFDKVGNTSTAPFAITPDPDPPVTTDNTAGIGSGWKNTTQTVILSPSDGAGSGAARTHYTTDGSVPTTGSTQGSAVSLGTDGVYTVRYFSIDNVGNVESVKTASTQIRIDKTPPSSAALDPVPSVIKNEQVLTGSGADALSGLASVAYYYCAGSSCAPSLLIGSSSTGPAYSVAWGPQPADGTYQIVARAIDAAGNTLDSAKRTVTIDNTAPNTAITASPPNPTNSTSASFSFTSTEAGSSFQCQLDGGGYTPCTSSQPYSGLAAGSHTFQVRATDPVGNTDATPASFTWTVDLTAPETTITASPLNPTNATSASFSFTSSEGGSSFQCALDGAAFSSCTSPRSYTGLAAGSHTFQVRATDPAGNQDATPASYTWVVDVSAPDTTITAGPPTPTSVTSASFDFTSTEPGSSFQCRLDGGAYSSCTSPRSYTGLADGSHTFEVRATDPAGNTDPTPASHTWTVDTTAPNTTITASPPNPTNATAASFSFTSTEAGSSFQCQLDGGGYTPCTSPQSYSGLAEATHTFEVRAIDGAGNTDPSPASYAWTIDATAPETTITAKPTNPTNVTSATFAFSSEAGASFQCSLDGAAFGGCSSPVVYGGLAEGGHTFEVRATDMAGNTDSTPASYAWTIDLGAPDTTITSAPSNPTTATTAAFEFDSTETGSTFACQLDGAGYTPCSSPQTYSSLAAGGHSFQVRATDGAGNTDPTPAAFSWTIDLTAPETTIGSSPANPTNATDATFTFSANEGGSTFDCRLDGGAFSSCTSPQSYSGLAEGSHTFDVRATDPAGNTDATPAGRAWTIDVTAPAPPVIVSPPEGSSISSGTVTLAGDAEAGSFVEVFEGATSKGGSTANLSGGWSKTFSGVADGTHTYTAKATDAAGNTSAASNARTVAVDTVAPNTTIGSGPLGSTAFTTATFSFTADDAAATFECSLDGAAFTSCTSPRTYSGLSEGSHTFAVRAIDSASNTDPTPATRTWTVDTTPPAAPVITSPLDGSLNNTGTVTLAGTAEPGSVVEVFEGATSKGVTSANAGGNWSRTLTGVAEGSHTYTAESSDVAGNTSTASNAVTVLVDKTSPNTTIDSAPLSPTTSTSASFDFSSSEAGTFECRLDGGAFSACTSPRNYTGLADGSHTFEVRAVDEAGNTDQTPASHSWTVDTTAPQTTIDSGPLNPTNQTTATFAFSSTEPGSSFECQLDGAAWSSCSTPEGYSGLAAGSHTFEVRATDQAGNMDGTSASSNWTVDVTAPETTIDSAPLDPTPDTTATFVFSSSEAGSSFECSLDGAAFAPCSSPETYSGLAAGVHTFEVRATDAAGNTDATHATHSWTVT